jgi:hypothetical protein
MRRLDNAFERDWNVAPPPEILRSVRKLTDPIMISHALTDQISL